MSAAAVSKAFRWAVDRWLTRPSLDLLVISAVIGSHALLVWLRRWPTLLEGVPLDRRPQLYGFAAIVVSLTGTLVSVSVAQYLNGRGERVKALKLRFPRQLGRTWRAIFFGSILAATLFLSALVADARYAAGTLEAGNSIGVWLFEVGVSLSLIRLLRLAVLFGELIDLIVLDDTEPMSDSEVEVDDDFFTPKPR